MKFTIYQGLNPGAQLIIVAFISIFCTLLLSILAQVISIIIFGSEITLTFESQNINALKLMQICQSLGTFVIPPFIIGWLFTGNATKYLTLKGRVLPMAIILVTLTIFAANPFISFAGKINNNMVLPEFLSGIEQWIRQMEDKNTELINQFIQVETIGGIIVNLIMIVLIPAVGEELLFRGVIQKIFCRITKNHHWAIWITAILFSALHLQFYGFIPRTILGALFGYMLVYSGSIWLPVIGHFINNLAAATFLYLEKTQGLKIDMIEEKIEQWPIVIVSVILTIFLIRSIKKIHLN
jgi:CAAX amino terminal protease family.